MIQTLVIIGIALVLALITCILIIKTQGKEMKKLVAENIELEMKAASLSGEIKRLSEAARIKDENRRKSDEKIENLHTGDAVDNAIHGLSNDKG